MLGPHQADTAGAEPAGPRAVGAVVRVGPDAEPALGVRVRHQRVHGRDQLVGLRGQAALEVLDDRRRLDRHLAEVDRAGRAVDGDHVAFGDDDAVRGGEAAATDVDLELVGAADAGLAHAAGDHGGVAGLAAPAGQDAARGDHAVQVVGVGLAAHQDDVLALVGQLHRARGVEDDLADRRAGRRADPLGDLLRAGAGVEPGEHQPDELFTADPGERLVHVDQALLDELHRDPERGGGGPLADAGLQHPELAALDGELDVTQVAVVVLQRPHDVHELVVGGLVDPLEVLQRHRVADAGHHVLALGVLEVVAVGPLLAGARVAGERDAGAGVVADVAEHHRDHVDGRAEVGRDTLLATVEDGAVGVPGVEHRLDRHVQLLPGLLREVAAGLLAHDLLERADQLLQVVGVQVEVVLDALGLLGVVDGLLERLAVDVQHGLAEHLDQPPVGVPGEPLVAGLLGQALHRLVRQADVEDRVHHARHRELRTGPDADQQRVSRVTELAAHRRLKLPEVLGDLAVQLGGRASVAQEGAAGFGGNNEPGRDRKTYVGHFGQVGTFTTQQILLVFIAFGEVINELRH